MLLWIFQAVKLDRRFCYGSYTVIVLRCYVNTSYFVLLRSSNRRPQGVYAQTLYFRYSFRGGQIDHLGESMCAKPFIFGILSEVVKLTTSGIRCARNPLFSVFFPRSSNRRPRGI